MQKLEKVGARLRVRSGPAGLRASSRSKSRGRPRRRAGENVSREPSRERKAEEPPKESPDESGPPPAPSEGEVAANVALALVADRSLYETRRMHELSSEVSEDTQAHEGRMLTLARAVENLLRDTPQDFCKNSHLGG